MLRGRKGSMLDIIFMVVILTVTAFGLIMGKYIYDEWVDESANVMNLSESATQITATGSQFFNILDYVFLSVLLGLTLSTIILAVYIKSHPILFFISLFLLLIALVIAAEMSNVWGALQDDPGLGPVIDSYQIMNNIMSHLPRYIFVIGCLVMVIFFGKRFYNEAGEGGGSL